MSALSFGSRVYSYDVIVYGRYFDNSVLEELTRAFI